MGTPTGPRVPWTVGTWESRGLGGTWESRGLPMVPLGLWDGKDSGTVVALVGHGNPKDFAWSPWDFGMSGQDSGIVMANLDITHSICWGRALV